MRQRSDRNIAAYNKAALRRAQVQSHVTERENGTFTVTLALRDDVDSLMHLELMMADRDSADKLAKRGKGAYLKARSREIYDMLVKRFKLDAPKKKARVQKDDVEDEEE